MQFFKTNFSKDKTETTQCNANKTLTKHGQLLTTVNISSVV
jgi:hypothetical protein